jgi:hypothetical protein
MVAGPCSKLLPATDCVECEEIFLLIAGERPAPEEQRWPSSQVQPSSQARDSESGSPQSAANVAPATPTPSFDWVLRGLNRPQEFVSALATFAFVMTALRPPFLFGRRVRYGWLWSHSGTHIELTRLLVEWLLIIVTGAVAVLFLSDSGDLAPVRAFRPWWTNRRSAVAGNAAGHRASTPLTKHPSRRFRRLHSVAIATAVIVVAAILLLRLQHDTSRPSDVTEPTQSQLNQQPETVAREPVVNQESVSAPAHQPVADPNARTQPDDPRPKNYNSLPTGTRIEEDVGTNGHGELTVKNGTRDDAVVRLFDAGSYQTVRWFFVQAHSSGEVAELPQGTYRLAFTTGLNWVESEDTFSWHPSYSEFERAFAYSEARDSEGVQYHSISVTLHAVPLGNVKTRAISREEFLKGHRHIPLQRP